MATGENMTLRERFKTELHQNVIEAQLTRPADELERMYSKWLEAKFSLAKTTYLEEVKTICREMADGSGWVELPLNDILMTIDELKEEGT
jgi:hypothetical protein